jgi:glycosyltransferase involved in cell wall biosynthesis
MRLATFPGVLRTNPYQRLLYEQLATHGVTVAERSRFELGWLWRSRRDVDVLHFHWPQSFWRHSRGPAALRPALCYLKLALFAARLVAARWLGYRIVWTIHQVYPHESPSPRLDRLGARALASASQVLIAHDEHTRAVAVRELGERARTTAIVPHGSYVGVYPPGRTRAEVRHELGLGPDDVAFLCFGHVRTYKDLDVLLNAFAAVERPDAALVIAGPVGDDGVAEDVQRAARRDPRIRPLLHYVADDAVAELFGACDVAIVARGDGGTSGAVILALSLGMPVVAAHRDAYEELLDGGRAGWLFEPGNEGALRDALAAAADDPALRASKSQAARDRADALGWPQIGARTAALIRKN